MNIDRLSGHVSVLYNKKITLHHLLLNQLSIPICICNNYRSWSVPNPEELEEKLGCWRKMIDEGKADKFIQKCEEHRMRIGCATSVIGYKWTSRTVLGIIFWHWSTICLKLGPHQQTFQQFQIVNIQWWLHVEDNNTLCPKLSHNCSCSCMVVRHWSVMKWCGCYGLLSTVSTLLTVDSNNWLA